MADQYTAIVNADGSADVTVKFDISGTGLPDYLATNSTEFHLDPLEATADGGSVWTASDAIAAVKEQAEAQKAAWILESPDRGSVNPSPLGDG